MKQNPNMQSDPKSHPTKVEDPCACPKNFMS